MGARGAGRVECMGKKLNVNEVADGKSEIGDDDGIWY